MPYTTPAYTDFIARFPIFNDIATYPQTVVEAILAEAALQLDQDWREVDYQPALMYLAAHMLAIDNSSEGASVDIGPGPTSVASESFSGMSVSYRSVTPTPGTAAASSTYGSTAYGRSYFNLLKKNKPAVVIA
jgi:hypothetical protein